MDRGEIETLVKKLYAARVDGDMDALAALYDDTVTFQIAGSPENSILATEAKGREEVMGLMQTITDTLAFEDFAVVDLLIAGNKAAVRWRATVNQYTANRTFETEIADFIEVADGKVVSLVEFLDTALAG